MKTKLTLFCLILALSLTGCSQSKTTVSDDTVVPPTEMEEEVTEDLSYIGTWIRLGTYTDGALVSSEPATFDLNPTTYTSTTALCENTGSVLYKGDNTITITIDNTTCPGYKGPTEFTYTYVIGEDDDGDKTMTTSTIYDGHIVTEEYIAQQRD